MHTRHEHLAVNDAELLRLLGGIPAQMRMRIDYARHQCPTTEIDQRHTIRARGPSEIHSADYTVFDQHQHRSIPEVVPIENPGSPNSETGVDQASPLSAVTRKTVHGS